MKKTNKRLISTLLVLLMVVSFVPTFAAAEPAQVSDYLTFTAEPILVTGTVNVTINVKYGETTLATETRAMQWGVYNLKATINQNMAGFFEFGPDPLASNTGISVTLQTVNAEKTGVTALYFADSEQIWNAPVLTINLTHTGHDFVETGRESATCTADGKVDYACSVCGETKTDVITMLGHNWGAWTYVDGSDTLADHSDSKHCRVCANDASHVEDGACQFALDAAQHVDPTETTDGKDVYVCSVCAHSYDVAIPATANSYAVNYDANGGTGAPESVTVSEQDNYPLSTTVPTHEKQGETDVLFIGWSETKYENVLTRNDSAPTVVTSIKVDGEKTVYATWGLDENGDGIPDVNQSKYTLSYDENGGVVGTAPTDLNVYLAGDSAKLDQQAPSHAGDSGKTVVFAGWTAEKAEKIYAKGETAPSYVTDVSFTDSNITVFAAWGYDENNNGKADVNEATYTLSYDVNGGANGPAAVSGLLAQNEYELDSATIPSHEDVNSVKVAFIGWTAAKDDKLYTKDDSMPAVIKKVDIADNTTVYAVYGYDTDGNGKADVTEKYASITYNANGGQGAPASETKALVNGLAEFTVSTTVPTLAEHSFIGWSSTQNGQVEYKAGDTISTGTDVILYAVWEQNPLVKYTLSFDANGGANAPAAQSVESRTGSGVLYITKNVPTRDEYVFLGWSTTRSGRVGFDPGDKVSLSTDVTLYAVWAKKTDAPQTGDGSNIALWASLAALSVLGMGAALYLGKKRSKS